MNMTSVQEILDLWKKHETIAAKAERLEVEALRRDIRKAQSLIEEAVARYRKEKLRVRSRTKANSEDPFAELAEYSSQEDIRTAYGYEMISETEMDRLMELWELRAQSARQSGPYTDRVTEMLELASRAVWDVYGEKVLLYDERTARKRKAAQRIAEENLLRHVRREMI